MQSARLKRLSSMASSAPPSRLALLSSFWLLLSDEKIDRVLSSATRDIALADKFQIHQLIY
jgi:hypothetical protein